MTWAKFGGEFRDECAEASLSDAAFRTHVEAVMYLYSIENMDMKIQHRLVRKWAGSDVHEDAIRELAAKGWWVADGDDWRIVHHEDVFRQSLAAQTKHREDNKERQRRLRSASNVAAHVDSHVNAHRGETQSDRQTDNRSNYEEKFTRAGAREKVNTSTTTLRQMKVCLDCRMLLSAERIAAGFDLCPNCEVG